MRKKIIACVLALAVAVAFMPTSAFAASTFTAKEYDQVLKSGNTVFCSGTAGLYRVKLKKGKVKKAKLVHKVAKEDYNNGFIINMSKKGSFVYYIKAREASDEIQLYRIKKTGKGKKRLADTEEYAIHKNKIYFVLYEAYEDDYAAKYYKMKLNGKKKRATKTSFEVQHLASNAKGYFVYTVETGTYDYDYLKTPKGEYYLGKSKHTETD